MLRACACCNAPLVEKSDRVRLSPLWHHKVAASSYWPCAKVLNHCSEGAERIVRPLFFTCKPWRVFGPRRLPRCDQQFGSPFLHTFGSIDSGDNVEASFYVAPSFAPLCLCPGMFRKSQQYVFVTTMSLRFTLSWILCFPGCYVSLAWSLK